MRVYQLHNRIQINQIFRNVQTYKTFIRIEPKEITEIFISVLEMLKLKYTHKDAIKVTMKEKIRIKEFKSFKMKVIILSPVKIYGYLKRFEYFNLIKIL